MRVLGWIGSALAVGALAGAAGSAAAQGQEAGNLPEGPLYRKPFLTQGSAAVGGYMDLEFVYRDDANSFVQHRFVPFIYAEVSDRVHVASEIEFEYGAEEVKVEFATVDFSITEAANFRAGIILSPLGRLNVLHDSPMLDLTERPLVNRLIIPSTLSESGLGFYGTIYPSESLVVDYEAYVVNGFRDATSGGTLNIRGARGGHRSDNNEGKSVVARLGVSPRLGTEFGASVHTGAHDDTGRESLTIAALDARFAQGPFEILGEGAMASAGIAEAPAKPGILAAAQSDGDDTAKAMGLYVEGRYHFLAGAVKSLPQSTFTAVVRVDQVDMDTDADGADQQRFTLGLNFRPTEQTVFKNDLLFDRSRASGASEWSDTETGYRFSVATYF